MESGSGTPLTGLPGLRKKVIALVENASRRNKEEAVQRLQEMIRNPGNSTKRVSLIGCSDGEFHEKFLSGEEAQQDWQSAITGDNDCRQAICAEISRMMEATRPAVRYPSFRGGPSGHARQSSMR